MFDIYSSVQLLEKEAAQLRDFFNAYIYLYCIIYTNVDESRERDETDNSINFEKTFFFLNISISTNISSTFSNFNKYK